MLFLLAFSGGALAPAASFAEETPFAQLAGSWKGSGRVRLEDGRSERLSCRGHYSRKGGSELTIAIQCQSEANTIDMHGHIASEGGRLSGNWEERTYGAEGELSGVVSASKISLRITGQVSGSMVVSLSGATHQVAISTAGPGFKGVSITFTR